jgi:ribosomal protein S2
MAKKPNQSYMNHKWIGGFETNWKHIKNVQKNF